MRISTIKPDALDYLVHLVREIMVRYFKCSYKNEGIPTCKELEAADIEVKRRAGSRQRLARILCTALFFFF